MITSVIVLLKGKIFLISPEDKGIFDMEGGGYKFPVNGCL
jgi:hypothetical protein